jgi:hypothetical protein
MENDNVTMDGAALSAGELPSTLDDSLRSLRLRRYESQGIWAPPEEETETETTANEADEAVEVEADETGEADEADYSSDELAVEEEAQRFFSEAFDDLAQEVRRVGREMFRTNRVAERNQELFDEAVTEIRQLSSQVALIPAQHTESLGTAVFEAKADLCRELLRMSDTLRASLAAADDLIRQFQTKAEQPVQGLASRFTATRQLNESLSDAVSAMKQWRTGQQLLADRLQGILRTAGVREIETAGRPFDPELHRAVSVAARNDVAPGAIVGEELTGYMLEGRILRYAEVIVAKNE